MHTPQVIPVRKPIGIRNFFRAFLLTSVFVLLLSVIFSFTRARTPTHVYAATSSSLNFQARLLANSGALVPDGNYHIEFKLYSASSGGSALWTETRTTGNLVRVVNGYLTVDLGGVTAFPNTINWDQEHWLTMNVGGSGGSPSFDGEMSPRLKLTAVPYAFTAGQLRKTAGANTSILDFITPTGNRTLNLPDQSGTLCVQGSPDCVDVATTNDTATTSSNSGLEVSADGLRLLGGCADAQMLRWNETAKLWECVSGSGSSIAVRESDGSPSTTASTLEFGPPSSSDTEFIITNEGSGVTRVRIGTSILTTGNYASTLDGIYVNESQSPAAGDISGSFTAGLSVDDVQNNAVDLGAETVGDYVQNLGTMVGLSITGTNSGEGSTPGLSVIYGSSANTAVQGNTQITCTSGSGDLSGGGTVITLGTGGTCGAITISEAPVFDTSVSTPLITYGGALTVQTTATAGVDDLIFKTAGTEVMRLLENGNIYLEKGTNDVTIAVNAPGAPATYTFDGATGTVLTTANYATNLDATYVNTSESPTAGDVSGSFTAGLSVNDVQNNAVDLGAETVGDYVQNLGTVVGLSITGTNSGEGSTPGLSVTYGSGANTSVQGNTQLTCPSGSGDLSGGGTIITLGTGGTCGAITIGEAPVFDNSVATPLLTYGGALTIQTTATGGADDLIFKTAGTEILRFLENGSLFFERGTNDATIVVNTPSGAPATYTFDGASGTVLTTANYTGSLDGTYVNVGESPAAGDVSGSFSAGLSVNDVQNNAVDLGAETVGDYVQNLGALVGLSTSGNSGEGSTPGLSVLYGSGANNAAAGANTFTCASGSGNLTGGGTVVTIGTSGTTCAAITTNAAVSFATSVTTPLLTNAGLLTVRTTATGAADDIVFETAGTERLRLLENGQLIFGTGANSANLYLSANDTLRTDDNFIAGGATNGLFVGDVGWAGLGYYGIAHTNRANTTDYALIQGANGATFINSATGQSVIFRVNNANGTQMTFNTTGLGLLGAAPAAGLTLPTNTVATGGIYFGTAADRATLYRSGADALATDDSFSLLGTGSNLTVQGTGLSNFAGNVDVAGTLAVGTSNAATIAANGLITTADDLVVNGGNIDSSGALAIASGGATSLTLTAGSGTIVLGSSTLQRTAASFTFDLANAGTSTFNISNSNGSNLANLDVSGALSSGNGNAFQVNTDGDITSVFTLLDGSSTTNGTSGLGTSTTLVLNSAANFEVGNYVQVSDTNCGGTGVNPCYAKITAKATNTLTITPALRWTNAKTVTEYHVPELGGTDLTSTLANRYGRGYFIAGVATGNGTTFYNENSVETSLDSFDLLNTGVTTLNIGGAATTITIGNSGTDINLLGSLQTAGSETITAGGGLIVGSGGAVINGGIDNNSGGFTEAGTLSGVAGITFSSGSLNLASGGITNTGSIAGVSTIDASGLITSVGLTAGSGLIQGTGGLTITGAVSFDGAISDPTGNLVLDDTVDIGSAVNGLRVNIDGSILDINGDLVLDDQLALGSATTGLQITTDGVISDLDDTSVTFNENVVVNSGGIFVTGNSTVTGTLGVYSAGYSFMAAGTNLNAYGYYRSVDTSDSVSRFEIGAYDVNGASQGGRDLVLNPLGGNVGIGTTGAVAGLLSVGTANQFQVSASGAVTAVGVNSGTGLITGTGGLTITGAASLDGALSDPTGNLVLDDTVDLGSASSGLRIAASGALIDIDGNIVLDDVVDIGSATTGLRVAVDGSIIDVDGAIVLNDEINLGSATTGLLVTTDGVISDLDDASIAFGESVAVTGNILAQQTGTGAAIIIDRTDGVIASLKSGLVKSGFYFDNAGTFTIATDTRSNIASGTGAGTEILTLLASGNVGIGDATPAATLTVGNGDLFQVAGATGSITTAGDLALNGGDLTSTGALVITSGAASSLTIDSGTTGALNLGGVGAIAKTINLGSGTAGDIINIATDNTTADTINIGSSTDTLTLTGSSASTFVINGVTVTATEFNLLDGKNAALVDQNDFIAGDGAGATSNGSGLEAGTGGIGLLQGCSNNQILKWVNASSVWNCAADATGISDARVKKNVQNVEGYMLDRIKDIRVVEFDYDCTSPAFAYQHCDIDHQTGVIAQEIAQIFPELVVQDEHGYYSVRYDALAIYNLKAVGELARSIRSNGDASLNKVTATSLTVNGVLEAGTIRADHIEGLDYVGRFESLEERVSTIEQQQTANNDQTTSESQQQIDLENLTAGNFTATGSTTLNGSTLIRGEVSFDKIASFASDVTINGKTEVEGLTVNTDLIAEGTLEVSGQATFKEMARFEKDVNFQGKISVAGEADFQQLTVNLDLIAKGALIVEGPATFRQAVKFEKDAAFDGNVSIKGQTTVGSDTAGVVTLPAGETVIKVEFSKPQTEIPIISLTLGDGKFAQYSYRNVTKDGFEIVVKTSSTDALNFSWIALQAKPKEVSLDSN